MIEKSIFISHSSKDETAALELGLAIENRFGKESVWIDYFDLSGSDELVPVISRAIGKAKWFILLASNQSMVSSWVVHEAKLAIFRSIEKKDFRVLTIKIDDCEFPADLDLELRSRKYIDGSQNFENAVVEVVELIASQTSTRSNQNSVFVDRGSEIDSIEEAFRDAKILYVVGWHGIGKTSVIEEFANTRLGSPFLKIEITPGHDLELLCRQIIARSNASQPSQEIKDEALIALTIQALEKKLTETNGFLFLDDAENAMDDAGRFRAYLEKFLNSYYSNSSLQTPLLLSLIQQPEIDIAYSNKSRVVVIPPLIDSFIVQCIEKWYYTVKREKLDGSLDLDAIVTAIGGHPLSAYLLASYLAFQTPELLNRKRFLSSFRKNVAEYILKAYLEDLNGLDVLLLQIIAVVSSGINIQDLSSLPMVSKLIQVPDILDAVKESLAKIAQRLLLIQDGEKLLLHPFLSQFFLDQAKSDNNYIDIAREAAEIIYRKTIRILEHLKPFEKDNNRFDNRIYRQLNYQLMDYLAPSHRLLLISGQKQKASSLPFTFRGHFREMVFVSYQVNRNYGDVLDYANQWLLVEPDDLEILTYKARALRRLNKTKEAEKILDRLSNYPRDRIQAIVSREYGFIAKDSGDLDAAIYHFNHAAQFRNNSGNPLYPLAQGDLAAALIDRAKTRGFRDPNRVADFQRALNLLDEVRRFLSNFDDVYLPLYVDALMNVGREKEALDLLDEALYLNNEEPRLNLRMADILRKDPSRLEESYECAKQALEGGQTAGLTIMAMIRLDEGKYQDALTLMKSFSPSNSHEQAIANTIEAKAYTGLLEFEHSRKLLEKLDCQNDPIVCLTLIENLYEETRHLYYAGKTREAKSKYYEFSKVLDEGVAYFPHHTQFAGFVTKRTEIGDLVLK